MFGSAEQSAAAEHITACLAAARDVAGLKKAVLKRHPENMSQHQWRQLRALMLDVLDKFESHLIAHAEYVDHGKQIASVAEATD
jgi:hypothetical protein